MKSILVNIELSSDGTNPTNTFARLIREREVRTLITNLFPNIEAIDLCRRNRTRDFLYERSDVESPLLRWFSNYKDGTIRVELGCGRWRFHGTRE